MHIISKKRLVEFWTAKENAGSQIYLEAWHRIVKAGSWQNLTELKETFPTLNIVDRRTVFNIGVNRYRLIARVNFKAQRIFILHILTHKEYDKDKWK